MAEDHARNVLDGGGLDGNEKNTSPSSLEAVFFEIHVKGQLSDQWSDWFENLEIRLLENGEMILSGVIPDQAALMGILNKLHRLNLTVRSVGEVDRNQMTPERRQNGSFADIES